MEHDRKNRKDGGDANQCVWNTLGESITMQVNFMGASSTPIRSLPEPDEWIENPIPV